MQKGIYGIHKKIGELFEVGLDSNDIIGYHGTSVDAILKMDENGRLPPGRIFGSKLFFHPIYLHECSEEVVIKNAEVSALANTKILYAFKAIEAADEDYIKITDLGYLSWDQSGNSEIEVQRYKSLLNEISKKYELTPQKLEQILETANELNRDGCILSFSRKLAKDFDISVLPPRGHPLYTKIYSDVPEGFIPLKLDPTSDTYIEVPNGLDIKYITGIEPLSQYEWDVLIKFQQK